MVVKAIARRIGRNPSSKGQLMNTDRDADGLFARGFATQVLDFGPERVANGYRRG